MYNRLHRQSMNSLFSSFTYNAGTATFKDVKPGKKTENWQVIPNLETAEIYDVQVVAYAGDDFITGDAFISTSKTIRITTLGTTPLGLYMWIISSVVKTSMLSGVKLFNYAPFWRRRGILLCTCWLVHRLWTWYTNELKHEEEGSRSRPTFTVFQLIVQII